MDLVYLNNLDPRSSFDRIVFLSQEPAVTRIKTVRVPGAVLELSNEVYQSINDFIQQIKL